MYGKDQSKALADEAKSKTRNKSTKSGTGMFAFLSKSESKDLSHKNENTKSSTKQESKKQESFQYNETSSRITTKQTGDITDQIDVMGLEGGVDKVEQVRAFRKNIASTNSLLDFQDQNLDLTAVKDVVRSYKQNSVKKRTKANQNIIGKFSQANMLFEEMNGPVLQQTSGRK